MKQIPVNCYLTRIEELKINPNFFVSEPYLRFSKVQCYSNDNWIWVEDDKYLLFPPLPLTNHKKGCPIHKEVWADFVDIFHTFLHTFHHNFLDYNYIFDSNHFNNLKGGKWAVYRKNINKWPTNNENWKYWDKIKQFEVNKLLSEWLSRKQKTVMDVELIIQFVLFSQKDIHRKALYDSHNNLMAINVWDENYKYINYRFCIVKENQPFLDEFSRFLFYTDLKIQSTGKLINDGGVLGSTGLERFKDKMNPIEKQKIYSWILNK